MGSSIIIPPPGVISDTNQSGLILILTTMSLSFVLVSIGIRAYVRLPNRLWRLDDHVLAVATVLSCIQSALVYAEVHHGLGKEASFDAARKWYMANNVMYILVLAASKSAVAFLYLRLTDFPHHLLAVRTILGVCIAWAVMSLLLVTINCPWQSQCINSFPRWTVVGVLDAMLECALAAMSLYLLRGLQMSASTKAYVVFAFSVRILTIAPLGLRLHYLNPSTLASNRSFAISLVVVCTQIQLGYGLMAASISCLRPFTAVYEKDSTYTTTSVYPHTGRRTGGRTDKTKTSTNNSFQLGSILHRRRDPDGPNPSPSPRLFPSFRPDLHNAQTYTATVSHMQSSSTEPKRRPSHDHGINKTTSRPPVAAGEIGREDTGSVESGDSKRLIITRQTDWSVYYDGDDSGRDEPHNHPTDMGGGSG